MIVPLYPLANSSVQVVLFQDFPGNSPFLLSTTRPCVPWNGCPLRVGTFAAGVNPGVV